MSNRLPTVEEHGEDNDEDGHVAEHSGHASLKKAAATIQASNRFLPSLVSQHENKSSRASSPTTSVADSTCSAPKRKLKLPLVKQGLSAAGKELLAYLRDEDLDIGEIEDMLRDSRFIKVVNERDEEFGWTPLHFMANRGHTHLAKVLLDAKAHPDVACNLGNTPLHLAARGNHMHVVTLFAARHAAVNSQNHNGWTALMCGAMSGHGDVLPSLLSASADASIVDSHGRNASMWAARHGHGTILETLLAQVPNLDLRDADGFTVADHAQVHRDLRRAVRKLFRSNQLLLKAARSDNIEAVLDALSDGAVVNARDSEGGSAIGWASTNASEGMVRLLLQHRADPNLASWRPDWVDGSDGFGEYRDDGTSMTEAIRCILRNQNRLLAAARDNDWDLALDALHAAVCIDNKDATCQRTALMWAAIHGAADAIEKIVDAHADMELRDSIGWTAVHYAVHHGRAEALSALHYVHADFAALTWEGDSAQHLAAKSGNWRMLYMLKAAKIDMEAVNAEGCTCLQVAAISQQALAVSALLALKANHEAKDHHGRNVFHLAVVNGHAEIALLLCESVHPPKYDGCGSSRERRRRGSCASSRVTGTKHKNVRPRADRLRAEPRHDAENNSEDAYVSDSGHEANSRHRKCERKPSNVKCRTAKRDDDESRHSPRHETEEDQHNHDRNRTHSKHRRLENRGHREKDEHEEDDHSGKTEEGESLAEVSEHRSYLLGEHSVDEPRNDVEHEQAESFYGSETHSMCARNHRCTSVARSVASTSSAKVAKRRLHAQASSETRTMTSLMLSAKVLCEGLPDELQSSSTAKILLSAGDGDGRSSLALALQFRHSALVPILIEKKADVNASDASGTTMLMSAAAWGERSVVDLILDARARVEATDTNGQQAAHYAKNIAIRRSLELLLEKGQVERRLASTESLQQRKLINSKVTSKSLPVLHSNKLRTVSESHRNPTIYRLRLESLPVRLPADMLENRIRSMLKKHGNLDPMHMSVAVDPITQKPQGYAYVDFNDPRKADSLLRAGGDILFGIDDSSGLFASAVRVAREATLISTDDLN